MARPTKGHADAVGIYPRFNGVLWLRQTVNGEQTRVSLETTDFVEAVIKAKALRGLAKRPPLPPWDLAMEKYLIGKTTVEHERDKADYTSNTAKTAKYAIQALKEFVGGKAIETLTSTTLKDFYKHCRNRVKKNGKQLADATAQNYTIHASTFLRSQGLDVVAPSFKALPKSRDVVLSREQVDKLIYNCPRRDLLFVLLAGFRAGMRKDEIIHARPRWFDLPTKKITIPEKDDLTGWTPKSKRRRVIRMSREFTDYFADLSKKFTDWKEKLPYILHPQAEGKRYRWDFRRPFADYMTAMGHSGFNPHSMRHTFITILAERGIPITLISAMSGDRIKTLETNYLHVITPDGVLDEAFEGKTEREKKLKAFNDDFERGLNNKLITEHLPDEAGK